MLVFVILGRNSPTALPLSPKLFPKMKQFRGGTNFSMNGNENIGWPATSRNPVAKIGKTKIKAFTPKNVIYHFHMYWLNLPRRRVVACLWFRANDGKPTIPKKKKKKRDHANDGRPTIPTLQSPLPEFDFQLEKLLFSWMGNSFFSLPKCKVFFCKVVPYI